MGNKIFLVFLFAVLGLAMKATARPQDSGFACGKNSHFTNCGVACPDKCSDSPLLGKICTAQCVIGCECDPGYVLTDAGNCVLRSEC